MWKNILTENPLRFNLEPLLKSLLVFPQIMDLT